MASKKADASHEPMEEESGLGLRRKDFSGERVAHFFEDLRSTLDSFNRGDSSVRMPNGGVGEIGQIASLLNDVISKNQVLTQELTRVSGLVGREGRLSERASLVNVSGFWKSNVEAVNSLIG
ncbi:MAG: hypothetical protein ACXWP5_14580, partial [Bdellovibrionota bacterium]